MIQLVKSVIKPFQDQKLYRSFWAEGALYRVDSFKRQPILAKCTINLEEDEDGIWCLRFQQEPRNGYSFPVTTDMQLVQYEFPPNLVHFEWLQQGERLGCELPQSRRNEFKDVVCRLIADVATRQGSNQTHLTFCKSLPEPPSYQVLLPAERDMLDEDITDVLYRQAQLESTRIAHTGKLFEVSGSQLIPREPVVFTIKSMERFHYSMVIFDRKETVLLERAISTDMNYSLNHQECYLKWVKPSSNGLINVFMIEFDKYEVPQTIEFAFEQCFYEMRNKITLEEEIGKQTVRMSSQLEEEPSVPASSILYIPPPEIPDDPPNSSLLGSNLKATPPPKKGRKNRNEAQPPTTSSLHNADMEVEQPLHFETEKKKKREPNILEKYRIKRSIVQAKVQDYTLESLGNSFQFLKIHDDKLDTVSAGQAFHVDGTTPLNAVKIVLHDSDQKAMMLGQEGQLSHFDLERMKVIEEYAPEGVVDICPERKMAELGPSHVFMGLTDKGVCRLDARLGSKGFQHGTFDYRRHKKFTHITSTTEGEIAIGSSDGELRLYPDDTRPTATVRYVGLGSRVLHLQTSKDRRWLLATYKQHLILLPTSTAENSCYHKKLSYDNRPTAKKLTIDPKHLKVCKVASLQLVPAHFNESKDLAEKYIVSGFDDYVVVWSLNRIINNEQPVYSFSRVEEQVDNVEFRFGDTSKMLMATSKRVRLKDGPGN